MERNTFIYLFFVSLSALLIGVTEIHAANTIGPKPLISTDAATGTLFTSPNGTGAVCSEPAPCDIWTAVQKASGGDVVFLRGGTYVVYKSLLLNNEGSAVSPVVFESYPGESAVFDGSQHPKGTDIGIHVTGKFIHLRGIEVKNMPKQGIKITGTDNVFDGMHVHHNGLSGIHISHSYDLPYGAYASRNIIRNSTVSHNSGAGMFNSEFDDGGNSDGISVSNGTDNRIENCLVYNNSDDGIDVWRSIGSYIGYNISHTNGIANGNGNGIKAGGHAPSAGTIVEHNLSYSNRENGIDYNGNVNAKFLNNTAWGNQLDYSLGSDTVAINNIASDSKTGKSIDIDNSWQRAGSVDFISTSPSSTNFLIPVNGDGFDDIGAFVNATQNAVLLPDVVVTQLSYANGIFTSTVKNQGTVATPVGTAIGVAYAVNGNYKTWGAVDGPLAPGTSVTISTNGEPYIIPDGTTVTIAAYADDANRFEESNKTNNQLSQSITVGDIDVIVNSVNETSLLSDVVVTQISYANGIFTSTVKNKGVAATPTGIAIGVAYSVNGNYKTWGAVDGPLAPGTSIPISTNGGSYIIPDGTTATITAYVDDVDRFKESNESNNQLSQSITVEKTLALPDVVVTQLSYANGIFTSTVKNQGTVATPVGITIGVAYSVNGDYKTWGDVIGPLAAGASVSISTNGNGGSYIIPDGTTATITAYVDDVDRFKESNESNNQLSQSITVR